MNLHIAQYFGIPLYFNLLTLPFALFVYYSREDLGSLALATYIFALFFVVLHEYGHCFMARRYGWQVSSVTILPIGGIAKIIFKSHKPSEEIAVALAGPAVNLLLMILFFGATLLSIIYGYPALSFVWLVLLLSNFILLAFNMLPIFPMDGGRVFRAILGIWLGHERGTWLAVRFSQAACFVLSIVAFYYGFFFASIIFIFMIVMGQNELAMVKLISSIQRLRINLAKKLNKPELGVADLPTMIAAVENSEDLIGKNELLHMLQDLRKAGVSI